MNDNMNKEQGFMEAPKDSSGGQKPWKMYGHGMCGCGYHRFFWLRLLLGLVILAVVFCIGVKVGEFKGAFGRDFGRQGGYNMRYFRQPMQAYPLGVPGNRMMVIPNTATTTPAK